MQILGEADSPEHPLFRTQSFSSCTELSYARNKHEAWRYPYAANNAFEACAKLATPTGEAHFGDPDAQEGHLLTSPAETDAAMAEEATQEVVSVHSSPSESPTIPSTEQPEDDDAHMEDNDSVSSSSAEAGDCLSNRPALPDACPAQDDMQAAGDNTRSALPPQNEDHPSDSPRSHSSESPIKRRPGPKAHTGRAQPKKSRKSLASTSRQPLGSVPEHEQPPATLDELASRNAQRQEAPVCRNPETPPNCPGSAQERPQAMTEIDIASEQEHTERGGTAATDLQLESEQRAMQILYDYQKAAGTTREAHGQKAPLPSIQIYSDLPREWPMARLAISNKQINRLVRTFLWRRVTEQALHGSSFIDIPDQINQAYIFFFHEYGRRVGMVPRSSLKEGKNRQMVEKETKAPKTNPKTKHPSPQAETPPSCSLPSTLGETCETETSGD